MKSYKKSQYETVKEFVRKHGGLTTWKEVDILNRTKDIAKIMYYQNRV
jgi:hypothetical protein